MHVPGARAPNAAHFRPATAASTRFGLVLGEDGRFMKCIWLRKRTCPLKCIRPVSVLVLGMPGPDAIFETRSVRYILSRHIFRWYLFSP
jgi:hypothetical protein